jgi:hypothetical protein
MSHRRLVLALAVALVTLVAGVLVPVDGERPADAASEQLEVVSQTPFVPVEGEFEVRLAWTGQIVDRVLNVRLFQVVGEEERLERAPSGQLNRLPPVPLVEVPRDDDGHLVVRIPIRSLPLPAGDPDRVYLPDPGVYPVELEITGPSEDGVATVITDLIRLPSETAEIDPVPVAVVLRAGSDGLGLADLVDLLERFPSVPITVLVDPVVLDEAALGEPQLLARLREALGSRTVVPVAPVPLDVSALAEIDHLELWDEVRDEGARRVGDHLRRDTSTSVLLRTEPPTDAATDHLAVTGVELLLALDGGEEGVLRSPAGSVAVVAPDDDLIQLLSRSSTGAYDVLARLAIRFARRDTTPVLLANGSAGTVPPEQLAVVLEGLQQPGIITPVGLEAVTGRTGGTLRPAERPRQDLQSSEDLLQAALDDIDEYESFYVSGPLPPSYLHTRVIGALATDVTPPQRQERLAAVRADVDDSFRVISLPTGRTVNLAATTSPLPLTVTNDASGPRRVRVRFESDKLTFPDEEGDTRLVEVAVGTSSVDFVVESRSIGVSPLDVIVTTPTGDRELARTRITIRSTAVPGLGLLLSGAALVFLLGWWVVHVSQRGRTGANEPPGSQPVA